MKMIRADQELTEAMEDACMTTFDAPCPTTPLREDWNHARDAAPTLDAVPVEELRGLVQGLKRSAQGSARVYQDSGNSYYEGDTNALGLAIVRLQRLLAKHASEAKR